MQQAELKELFIDELKDIFSAETQLVKALPKMARPLGLLTCAVDLRNT